MSVKSNRVPAGRAPASGAGGGPMRTRRRLTRAQRRPLERRSRGGWDRSGPEHSASSAPAPAEGALLPRHHAPRAAEGASAHACGPAHPGDSSDSNDGATASTAAATPPRLLARHDALPCALGLRRGPGPLCARDLNSVVSGACASAGACEAECPGSPADPPACVPALALAPGTTVPAAAGGDPAAAAACTKDALQQRLLLLRRRDGLIDITIRTMKLMRRNQLLQHRLMALQAETRAFVHSVLSNPENRGLSAADGRSPSAAAAAHAVAVATPRALSPAALALALAVPASPASPAGACSSSASSPASSPVSSPSSSRSSSPASSPAPSPPPAAVPSPAFAPTTC